MVAELLARGLRPGVDWITYRRGKLGATTASPRRYWRVDAAGRAEVVTLAEEMVAINDYGPARQLTLYEHDKPVLQVLTSDLGAPAAALLAWLRCRWRIENVFKYLTAHHGIDWLCHYGADIAPDTALIDNPARKRARNTVKRAETTLAEAQQAFAELLHADMSVAATNAAIPAAETNIDKARAAVTRARDKLKTIPAKIPANQHDPNAQRAILATLRHLLHLGGQITYTTTTITVALDIPPTPKDHRGAAAATRRTQHQPALHPRRPPPITYKLKTA